MTTTSTTTTTRQPRRAVRTSTNLSDFNVPRRSRAVRRTVSTTVTTRPAQRRVRVAALTRSDVVSYGPAIRVTQRAKPRRIRVASLGRIGLPSMSAPRPSLSGGGIAWRANAGCLAGNLRSIVASVASSFGSVTVNSTCRGRAHNRRVGGASRSWHLTGNAVDFRVHGANIGRLSAYLRSNVGGFKHYGGGRYHIDNGPKRSF